MTLLATTPTTGLEEIQRQAFLVLLEGVNDAITEVETYWAASDEALATRLGLDYTPTVIERVEDSNFYEGHRPSLIGAPIERYPNVAVMVARATPDRGSDLFDHVDVYTDLMAVEVMVKASAEDECNRRVQRVAAAVHVCLMANQTLNGSVSGLTTAPTLNISDLFTRKERSSYGPQWYWQGARLDYAVRKEAVIPSSSTGFFRSAEFGIDQD